MRKRSQKYYREQGGVCERVWREEREEGNVILKH